jgi:N-acetylneuraminate synthase
LPVIASTGGLATKGIDELVSFFDHRGVDLALLHCVALYPTDHGDQHLAHIQRLKRRYPGLTVGYSGHEDPSDLMVGPMAVGLGAEVLERHVGVPTESIQLNAYSMNPEQTSAWLASVVAARRVLGSSTKVITAAERDSLLTLQRGVFAKRPIAEGSTIRRDDVFFAMPCEAGQLTSGAFGTLRASFVASRDYDTNEAIFESCDDDLYLQVRAIVHEAKGMLAEAGVVLNDEAEVELSHHYGLANFAQTGCLIVNLINREYCKKIIVVFPGQEHPEQHHLRKEETFHVLAGEVDLERNGLTETLRSGDIGVIERGVRHSFRSTTGAVIEEVSTTHFRDDSFYTDPRIAELDPMQRKTILEQF